MICGMKLSLVLFLIASILISFAYSQGLRAGVAKVNGTLVGLPLAGYNHGQRRVPYWPLPVFTNYTTFMTPSLGFLEPTWFKTLVLDDGETKISFSTIDGIGADGTLNELAYTIAVGLGFTVPWTNCIFSGSHSHSGPGAISPETLWAMAPATDLMVPAAQRQLATAMAQSMIEAEKNLAPAKMDIGMGYLVGVTANRRASISPYVTSGTIDPHLGVIRVDNANGTPLATLWNFAIHGVCYGPDNLYFSGDIMGAACSMIEQQIGGIALFVNGDAGDIDPAPTMCDGAPNFKGSGIMAAAVKNVSQSLNPTSTVKFDAYTTQIDFGWTDLNYTLQRFNNCTSGGELDICSICMVLQCDLNAHMPESWIEDDPRFTGFRIDIGNTSTLIVTLPGEPLVELGWWVRNDTLDMGFDQTFLAGYTNSHMGYFATPDEYDIGGYESQLTFWGIDTAAQIRAGCKKAASAVAPSKKLVKS